MPALVPADVDLKDFAFMPLDVHRLLTSETWVLGNGDERAAAMTLWLNSWHQVPAGSLPDNDRMLEHLASCKTWKRSRSHALRGWVSGGDGRLYHPVVCEKALEAWLEKLAQRLSSGAGNARRWGASFDPAAIEERMQEARTMLLALNPDSRALRNRRTAGVPKASGRDPGGNPGGNPGAIPSGSQETGTGTETGIEDQELESPDGDLSPPSAAPTGGDLLGSVTPTKPKVVPPCPVERIIELYHEALPQLARVREFPDTSRAHLRTRWREKESRQSLDWWRKFFVYVGKCPFLIGQKTDFTADLLWLVAPKNFAKVINGNYQERAA